MVYPLERNLIIIIKNINDLVVNSVIIKYYILSIHCSCHLTVEIRCNISASVVRSIDCEVVFCHGTMKIRRRKKGRKIRRWTTNKTLVNMPCSFVCLSRPTTETFYHVLLKVIRETNGV